MHPLTECEKARCPGAFLKALLEGAFEPRIGSGAGPVDPAALAHRLVAGGYPERLARPPRCARQWPDQPESRLYPGLSGLPDTCSNNVEASFRPTSASCNRRSMVSVG